MQFGKFWIEVRKTGCIPINGNPKKFKANPMDLRKFTKNQENMRKHKGFRGFLQKFADFEGFWRF